MVRLSPSVLTLVAQVSVAILLLHFPTKASARGFRDGFSGSISDNFMEDGEDRNMLGTMPEQEIIRKFDWELGAFDLDGIKDKRIRTHIRNILKNDSVLIRPEMRTLKTGGMRAIGVTREGKKIRAKWGQGQKQDMMTDEDYLEIDYNEALLRGRDANLVHFDLLLPPLKGTKQILTLEYTLPIGMGNVNPEAVLARGPAKVKLFVDGDKKTTQGYVVGSSHIGFPQRPGLVDPAWAKGRKFFRKGRSVGQV